LWQYEIASLDLALPRGFGKAPMDAPGMLAAGRDYLLWGDCGLHVAHLDASTARFAFKQLSEGPVRAIAQRGGRVFLLRDEVVEICRADGLRIASIEAPRYGKAPQQWWQVYFDIVNAGTEDIWSYALAIGQD
jgi:hypothetical protein